MKRILALMAVGLLLAPAAYADETSSASAHVYVDVVANIAVQALDAFVDMGDVQAGEFTGRIPFRIDANTEKVQIGAAASHLFKGNIPGDPDSVEVAPIYLCTGAETGVVVLPALATPVGGGSNVLGWNQPQDVGGFPGMGTSTMIFESAQNNHFSQDVDLEVCWNQDDDEKPMGEYSGVVEMHAWIVLPQ